MVLDRAKSEHRDLDADELEAIRQMMAEEE